MHAIPLQLHCRTGESGHLGGSAAHGELESGGIEVLESAQRRAERLGKGLKCKSHEEQQWGLSPKKRRLRGDLFFSLHLDDRRVRPGGVSLFSQITEDKLHQERFRWDFRENIFM